METENRNNNMLQAAMKNGTLLGTLWIAAFTTYVLSLTTPDYSLIFIVLLVASPIFAIFLGRRYRKNECENRLGYINAWSFMIIIHLCASILTAIACYVYFRYLDHGTALASFKAQIDLYSTLNIGEEMKKALSDTYDILAQMTASDFCMQYLSSSVFFTTFLAPITALFIYKK